MQKSAKKKEVKQDPVELLICHDKTLARRDCEAKLFQIRQKKALRKRIYIFDEATEDYEDYKKWFYTGIPNTYFAMYARHRTCYRKGEQLLNSYGARDNRFLLTNYGFTLRQNKYNSLGFKVFLNYREEGRTETHAKIIKIKKNKLSQELLQYLRASLIFSFQKKHGSTENQFYKNLLVSVPVNPNFEKMILNTGINLIHDLLYTKYATSLEEDE